MAGVVVTGLGAVTCMGTGVGELWSGMQAAASLPRPADDPWAHMDHPLMYSVGDEALRGDPAVEAPKQRGRASRFALAAAREAITDAAVGAIDPARVAVCIGTGMGDSGRHEERRVAEADDDDEWSTPFSVASAVGGWLGAEGVNASVSNACAAGGFALSLGADLIAAGEADVVIAGGAEAYSRVALGCFNRLGAVDPVRCRPFDRHRRGTVFGEGAAVLVLESERRANERGAHPSYARLVGAGWSCDAHHMTAPEPSGEQIDRAMRRALDDAQLRSPAIGCVVPHGTGTVLNDVVEARVLQRVLHHEPDADTPLYSLKALLGHTGGAAGALATLAAALILHRGEVPPNVALDELDPECAVHLPQGRPSQLRAPAALVNAYAFGGNNISLVLAGVA